MSRQAEGNACLSAPVRTGASGGLSGRRPGGGSGSHKPSPPGRGKIGDVLLAQQAPGSCARVCSSGVGIDLRLPKATTSGDPAGAAAANSPRGTLGKDTRTWGGGRRVEETRQCPRTVPYLSGRSGTSEIFLISSPILYFIVFHRISLYVTYEKLASNSFAFLICKYSGASSRRRSKTCWILRSTFCAQLVFTVCVRIAINSNHNIRLDMITSSGPQFSTAQCGPYPPLRAT